jgi:hypothetical protein
MRTMGSAASIQCCDGPARDVSSEVRGADVVTTDPLERLVPLAQLQVLRHRNPELQEAQPGELTGDVHQPVRLRIWQWPEHDAIDNAEDRAVGANAKSEREDRERGKARALPQFPQRVADVVGEGSHDGVGRAGGGEG